MHTGHILWISLEEGHGLIGAPHQPDVLFHKSELEDSLKWDEELMLRRVRFRINGTARGPTAKGIEAWSGASFSINPSLASPSTPSLSPVYEQSVPEALAGAH